MPDLSMLVRQSPSKRVSFDAAKHLNFVPPEKIYSMAEIGHEDAGISPNAVSMPFSLFTEEAVMVMRDEILQKKVLEEHQFSSNLAAFQLRGYATKHAPFIYDAWNSPEVLKIVSDIAGIELVPVMDFEIGHINISISPKHITAESQADARDEKPIVGWHTDSYAFVAVLMMSDCSGMIGGETALRQGDGSIMKVRGPTMGNAVILQGRYIEHQALRALGGAERITMVTSFRARNPFVRDDTVLTTVRPVSDLSELYSGYTEYRLDMLEERLRAQLKKIRRRKGSQKFDTAGTKRFLQEHVTFMQSMLAQMVDEEDVVAGLTDSSHLLSEDLKSAHEADAKAFLEG